MIGFRIFFSLVLLVAINENCFARGIKDTVVSDLMLSGNKFCSIATDAPDALTRNAFWIFAGAGALYAISHIDETVRQEVLSSQSEQTENVFRVVNVLGDNKCSIGLSLGAYGAGLVFDRPQLRRTGRQMIETLILATIVNHAFKIGMGRARPHLDRGATEYNPFTVDNAYHSLGSGHAATVFALATVLSDYFDNTYVSLGLYSLATATSTARVYLDQHWCSDVLLGAAIGYLCAKWVIGSADGNLSDNIHFSPTPNGLAIVYNLR